MTSSIPIPLPLPSSLSTPTQTYSTTLSAISGYRATDSFTTLSPLISLHRGLSSGCIVRFETRFKKFARTNVIFRHLKLPTIEGPGDYGDWVALCLPEAVPTRIAVVGFFACFGFRFDDMAESMTSAIAQKTLYSDILAVLNYNLTHGHTKDGRLATLARLYTSEPLHPGNHTRQELHECLQQGINELLDLDLELGMKVLESMMLYYLSTDTKALEDFEGVEEYAEYRRMDWGANVKLALLAYALNIHLPASPTTTALASLTTLAMNAALLTNDYYSYRKETLQSRTLNLRSPPINAVSLLLRLDPTLPLDTALAQIKDLALQYEAEFKRRFERRKWWDIWASRSAEDTAGKTFAQIIAEDEEMLRFVDGLALFVAGNAMWSAKCKRYHGDVAAWNTAQERHRRAVSAGVVMPMGPTQWSPVRRNRGLSAGQGAMRGGAGQGSMRGSPGQGPSGGASSGRGYIGPGAGGPGSGRGFHVRAASFGHFGR